MQINEIVNAQRCFFETGNTLSVPFRAHYLLRLKTYIKEMEGEIAAALKEDLGKCPGEGFLCETLIVLDEIDHMLKNISRYTAVKPVRPSLFQLPAVNFSMPEPYGVVLIMSPWNYPFNLTLTPLVDAIAAGNTAVVKPSAYSPATSAVIKKLIRRVFPSNYVTVIEGGRDVNADLLDQKFDYIFFTGGKTVGRLVMEKASKNLTPVSLELGGKSPCIVDATADIALAARRIVFGKFINVGQTCIAPDYILVDETVGEALLEALEKEIVRQYGEDPLSDPDYGRIVNEKHYNRLLGLMSGATVYYGGGNDGNGRIEPTILTDVTTESPVMQEEIFGPILPVLTFKTLRDAKKTIMKNPTPLALYMFSKSRQNTAKMLREVRFGGGCVNDTILHITTTNMGFGGVGESGMGSYHGKAGFDTFTHYKNVTKRFKVDLPVRFRPYKKPVIKLIGKYFGVK